jgi:hypothetical protein
MRVVLRIPGRSRRARHLTVALAITLVGLVACGGDDSGAADTSPAPSVESDSSATGEPILIKTSVTFTGEEEVGARGDVLDGSTIGDSPFCPGGTFEDRHGSEDPSEEPYGLVDRTYECPDGTVRMGFSPQTPVGDTQSGPWKIVSGTGALEGLQGTGEMKVTYDEGDEAGRETFTGTVTQ